MSIGSEQGKQVELGEHLGMMRTGVPTLSQGSHDLVSDHSFLQKYWFHVAKPMFFRGAGNLEFQVSAIFPFLNDGKEFHFWKKRGGKHCTFQTTGVFGLDPSGLLPLFVCQSLSTPSPNTP